MERGKPAADPVLCYGGLRIVPKAYLNDDEVVIVASIAVRPSAINAIRIKTGKGAPDGHQE